VDEEPKQKIYFLNCLLLATCAQVDEEAKAVFNCMCTFENMVETDPSVAEQVCIFKFVCRYFYQV
jgi:hypothetical protein